MLCIVRLCVNTRKIVLFFIFKYILFKVTDANIRLETLYSNNLVNIYAKYEVLEDKNAHNMIVEKGETW